MGEKIGSLEIEPRVVAPLRRHCVAQEKERRVAGDDYRERGLVFSNTMGGFLARHQVTEQWFPRLLARADMPRIRWHDCGTPTRASP